MSFNDYNRIAIKNKIIEYSKNETIYLGKGLYFTPNLEADELIRKNSLAFVIGVILDQGQKAERVWATPFELKKRLGHLDPFIIAKMTDQEIQKYLKLLQSFIDIGKRWH